MLIIEPRGGLCNRMRVVDAALALGQSLKRPVRVIWCADAALGCRMTDLFAPIPALQRVIHTRETNPLGRKLARLIVGAQMMRCDFVCRNVDTLHPAAIWRDFDFTQLAQYARCYIHTHHRFHESDRHCRDFKPRPHLQRRIDDHLSPDANVVGLHIRRGDHRIAIESSPTDLFFEAAEREVAQNPDVRFFLATDDDDVEMAFIQRFGPRVIVQPKRSRERSEVKAMEDAVVDLYCLARCRRILGSHRSSFSITAADIGHSELVTVRKTETRTP